MAVRTKRLASGRVSVDTSVVLYTCPAGETCIIKSITLFNVNSSVANVVAILHDLGSNLQTPTWEDTIAARKSFYLERWQVLLPGERLGLKCSVAGGINYLVSGTELEGLAD